jgi:arsenate reductase (glutaredoxin)
VEIWFNPRCSKCRIARDAAEGAGLTYNLRYYLEEPPSGADLREVLARLTLEPWEICRTAEASAAGVTLPARRDAAAREQWIAMLAENPALLQRPLVVADDGTAYVARDPDSVNEAIQHSLTE